MYIYMYKLAIAFHGLNMIMYFGRSKCEASAGRHGVVLHQCGYSKGFNVAVFRKLKRKIVV